MNEGKPSYLLFMAPHKHRSVYTHFVHSSWACTTTDVDWPSHTNAAVTPLAGRRGWSCHPIIPVPGWPSSSELQSEIAEIFPTGKWKKQRALQERERTGWAPAAGGLGLVPRRIWAATQPPAPLQMSQWGWRRGQTLTQTALGVRLL